MKPQENGEFLAQLAQFSSLEKLTAIETSIKELTAAFETLGGTRRPARRPAAAPAAAHPSNDSQRRRRTHAVRAAPYTRASSAPQEASWRLDPFRPVCPV